jgi:tetratricopeptide (TPR) repeat protein
VVAFWEGLSPEKRDWLWSEQKEFWGYLGQVFEAYARKGDWKEAEAFAHDYLDDPASPSDGRPLLGIPLARRLMQVSRIAESLELYEQMAREAPTNPLCADAWYWLSLVAYNRGETRKVKEFAARIRAAQGTQVGLLDAWNLDARALLLLANLDLAAVDPQAVNYTSDTLQKQLQFINEDLERIAI